MNFRKILSRWPYASLLITAIVSSAVTWAVLASPRNEQIGSLQGQVEDLQFEVARSTLKHGEEAASPHAGQGQRRSGITYDIPDGWIKMGKIEIAVFNDVIASLQTGTEVIAGYRPHGGKPYTRPYITVSKDPSNLSLDELFEDLEARWTSEMNRITDLMAKAGQKLETKLYPPKLDREHGVIWTEADMEDKSGAFRMIGASIATFSDTIVTLNGFFDTGDREIIEQERLKRVIRSMEVTGD